MFVGALVWVAVLAVLVVLVGKRFGKPTATNSGAAVVKNWKKVVAVVLICGYGATYPLLVGEWSAWWIAGLCVLVALLVPWLMPGPFYRLFGDIPLNFPWNGVPIALLFLVPAVAYFAVSDPVRYAKHIILATLSLMLITGIALRPSRRKAEQIGKTLLFIAVCSFVLWRIEGSVVPVFLTTWVQEVGGFAGTFNTGVMVLYAVVMVFAGVLNRIFAVGSTESRGMVASVIVALFAGMAVFLWRNVELCRGILTMMVGIPLPVTDIGWFGTLLRWIATGLFINWCLWYGQYLALAIGINVIFVLLMLTGVWH